MNQNLNFTTLILIFTKLIKKCKFKQDYIVFRFLSVFCYINGKATRVLTPDNQIFPSNFLYYIILFNCITCDNIFITVTGEITEYIYGFRLGKEV